MFNEDFINGLKMQPETYKTILKDKFDNRNTITNVVRKKINNLINYRFICAGVLDGTRFGEKIFYNSDKNYLIVITRYHQKFTYYYCKEIKEVDEFFVVFISCFELCGDYWKFLNDLKVNRSCLIRFF